MEELEQEIEAAAPPEEPEQDEDELLGEPEEENTGKHPHMDAWMTDFYRNLGKVPIVHFPSLPASGDCDVDRQCCTLWVILPIAASCGTQKSASKVAGAVQGNGLPGRWMQSMWPARRLSLRRRTCACWTC